MTAKLDDWEQLDLAGRQLTELIRAAEPGEVDELLRHKNQINLLKRQMAVIDGCQPREALTLKP